MMTILILLGCWGSYSQVSSFFRFNASHDCFFQNIMMTVVVLIDDHDAFLRFVGRRAVASKPQRLRGDANVSPRDAKETGPTLDNSRVRIRTKVLRG